MEHIWSVLCRLSVIDTRRNNVSLIEVLERLGFSGLEIEVDEQQTIALPYSVELVSMWTRSDLDVPEVAKMRISIKSPSGDILNPEQQDFAVNLDQHTRARIMVQFPGLPFVGNGVYRFVVQGLDEYTEDWREFASVPLELVKEVEIGE
jgi:hypothetical protein